MEYNGHPMQVPSPWLETLDLTPAQPLREALDADVAIIGAGYSGLSTALALRQAGLRVAVLESRYAGFGASGRNAGHLTPTIGKDLPTLVTLYSAERVAGLLKLADAAIAHVEAAIVSHAIDCDYEPVGNVIAAVHPRQHANLDRAAAAARRCGVPGELLEPGDMRRRGLPPSFTRGWLEPHGGVLNPGKYVRGLRRAALDAGALLFEDTPVTAIDARAPALVSTPGGLVRARHVVVATNAFTPELGRLRSRVLRTHVQLFQTAPLTPAQLARVGWQGREGVYTAHEMLESYRLTKDDRIVGGAKLIRYGFRGRWLPDVDPRLAAFLERTFRARFPELADVAVTRHWGGPIAFALDFLPLVGRDRRQPNVLHAVAYAGHGLALASYAGTLLADLILERESLGSALWTRTQVPLPPEPLRWLTVRGLTAFFGRIDRKADGFPW